MIWWVLAAIVLIGGAIVVIRRRSRGPFRALILLYRTPTLVQPEPLKAAAERAGVEIEVSGNALELSLLINGASLKVMQAPMTYGAPQLTAEQMAAQIPESRLREAILEHKSFASFFSPSPMEEERWNQVLISLGRVLAEYADDEALLLWRADNNHCIRFSPEMREQLIAGNILELFAEGQGDEVMLVDPSDDRIAAAVAEARSRWPEFVEALGKGGDPELHIVKGPLGDGHNVEYMWIAVERVADETIQGKLMSSPFKVRGMKQGDQVSLPVSELNDWAFFAESGPVGMFTEKIVRGG